MSNKFYKFLKKESYSMTAVINEVQETIHVAPEPAPEKSKNSFWSLAQKAWAALVNCFFIAVAIVTVPYLLICGAIPLATGSANLNVLSGSMAPNINVGDKVFSQPVDANTLQVGDVITYLPTDNRTGGVTITHRVKDFVYEDGKLTAIITKGDANPAQDEPVLPTQVTGKIIMVIPYAGNPFIWLHNAPSQQEPLEW